MTGRLRDGVFEMLGRVSSRLRPSPAGARR